MSRPLLITDCDEVLLHMVVPFRQWVDEEHGVNFDLSGGDFSTALTDQKTGDVLKPEKIWALLGGFFDTEMHRQTPIDGAVEGLAAINEVADIVILTNLMDHRRDHRAEQLAKFGIDYPVYTNQGPKGGALKTILDEHQPGSALFIDDLPQHHDSVGEVAPHVWRLHMVGEPEVAPHIDCAETKGHAHVRIDLWSEAQHWIIDRLTSGADAPAIAKAA
ncbi:HAD family hydrolase [Alterisphingorhabdus coralli]|uniref:HAD family hydrolase n=1 Tax=Alterisphingorhabdus coralli TaxID=3071408 RepID=A0AA97F8G4_9SPHN|nr:HAD family hydrolase [Parasphingorhabdus sp. SCSIO 66989]WOE75218.1 HAD family hydrolase [Parasphingorhabdus sp. SCSIO 66989]